MKVPTRNTIVDGVIAPLEGVYGSYFPHGLLLLSAVRGMHCQVVLPSKRTLVFRCSVPLLYSCGFIMLTLPFA